MVSEAGLQWCLGAGQAQGGPVRRGARDTCAPDEPRACVAQAAAEWAAQNATPAHPPARRSLFCCAYRNQDALFAPFQVRASAGSSA